MYFKPREFQASLQTNSWEFCSGASPCGSSAVQHLQVCASGVSGASLWPSEINWLNLTLPEMNSPPGHDLHIACFSWNRVRNSTPRPEEGPSARDMPTHPDQVGG